MICFNCWMRCLSFGCLYLLRFHLQTQASSVSGSGNGYHPWSWPEIRRGRDDSGGKDLTNWKNFAESLGGGGGHVKLCSHLNTFEWSHLFQNKAFWCFNKYSIRHFLFGSVRQHNKCLMKCRTIKVLEWIQLSRYCIYAVSIENLHKLLMWMGKLAIRWLSNASWLEIKDAKHYTL